MAEIINRIAEIVQQLILTVGYPGIFLMQFAENVFPPVPTDTLLPFSGVVAASGRLHVLVVWAAAVTGGVSGSLVLYAVGAWLDERLLHQFVRRYGWLAGINEDNLSKALGWFNRYGAVFIFFGRLLPVMRSVVSLTAGMSRMPLLVFVSFTALSSGFAMGFWIGVGYLLGENWQIILGFIDQFEPLIVAGIVIILTLGASMLGWRLLRRMQTKYTEV